MSRHGPEPFNERWPANTMGRRLSGDDSHVPTRRTADSMFEGLAASFNSMEFVDDQVGGTGLRTLPTVEEMEARMRRSSENSFLGRAARQYGAARGLSSNRGFPFVSALQRPGSNATNHRSQSYEPRPPVSVIDERYLWTGDRSRPRRSGGESSEFLTGSRSEEASLFGNLFGESLGARLHRSVAANMVRSFLSSMAGPVAIPWPGPWEVRMGLSLGAAHRPEHHRHSRRVLAGPNSSLVLFAAASADPAAFDVLDHNVWRFMQEVERRFAFEDLDELDTPLMLVVSGGHAGDGDDVVSHIWADTSENRVTLQQLSEARSLVDALDRHTIKWTFGGAKESDAHPTTASHMMEAPARTRGGTPQQMRRGLGARDASRDTAADSSAAGAKIGTHNGYDCCICLSAFEPGDALLTLRCFHIFHERCIERWIKTSHSIKCPLCSTKIADSPRTDHFDE
ncbi:zinc finger (C3HC4 RING finger) protein, putative [Eimeria praecox]|uniref:RING-type E3 ubiquitin transferase n=1 Tax=Eimeria praecox TaxID=51316 RepID=U6G2Y9_9EIME|nr:zinc finger (C3HC4 RING finger) protein, putative [Eimeria praecox]